MTKPYSEDLRTRVVAADRQSRLAQEPENPESDRGRGRRTAFPAALLARPEPDRDGLFEIEDAPAKGFRTIRRSPLDPHRRTPQSLPAERM